VCTPDDAYRCCMRTDMDALVVENFVLEKAEQTPIEADENWRREFVLDWRCGAHDGDAGSPAPASAAHRPLLRGAAGPAFPASPDRSGIHEGRPGRSAPSVPLSVSRSTARRRLLSLDARVSVGSLSIR